MPSVSDRSLLRRSKFSTEGQGVFETEVLYQRTVRGKTEVLYRTEENLSPTRTRSYEPQLDNKLRLLTVAPISGHLLLPFTSTCPLLH